MPPFLCSSQNTQSRQNHEQFSHPDTTIQATIADDFPGPTLQKAVAIEKRAWESERQGLVRENADLQSKVQALRGKFEMLETAHASLAEDMRREADERVEKTVSKLQEEFEQEKDAWEKEREILHQEQLALQEWAREDEVARANAREALDGEVASLQAKLSAAQEQIQGMSWVIIETLIIWCHPLLCCAVL